MLPEHLRYITPAEHPGRRTRPWHPLRPPAHRGPATVPEPRNWLEKAMSDYGGTAPAGEAAARTPPAPVQRSAPEEFGRLFVGAGRLWSLAQPLVFAGGLGLLSWGAGMALMQ